MSCFGSRIAWVLVVFGNCAVVVSVLFGDEWGWGLFISHFLLSCSHQKHDDMCGASEFETLLRAAATGCADAPEQ